MDTKPLIGISVWAVILLVLASLWNVVGYQSVKSTMYDSPLFNVRTHRAINQQQNILTFQYIGKGKDMISFPLRDTRTVMMQKCINQIRSMDDNTFNTFVTYVIHHLAQQEIIKYYDTKDIEQGIYLLRKNTAMFDDSIRLHMGNITWGSTPTLCWSPGCFLYILYSLFLIFVLTFAFNCFPSMKMCLTLFHCHKIIYVKMGVNNE